MSEFVLSFLVSFIYLFIYFSIASFLKLNPKKSDHHEKAEIAS
jgi:hypothetical protein